MNLLLEVIALLAVAVLSNGLEEQKYKIDDNNAVYKFYRRLMHLPSSSVIIGAPSYPNHLPEAEAILPGHTLIRPGLGMLKSALKFPHRELEGGSGVYGNEDSLSIRYDGRNERVLYTRSRRANTGGESGIVLIIPRTNRDGKPEEGSKLKMDPLKQVDVLERLMKTLLRYTDKNERRQQAPAAPKPQSEIKYVDDNSEEVDKEDINLMKSVETTFDVESQTAMPKKQELFWKSKDLFTHIKIDQHAPEYSDFLPINIKAGDMDGIRKWWFYHQADHKEILDDE